MIRKTKYKDSLDLSDIDSSGSHSSSRAKKHSKRGKGGDDESEFSESGDGTSSESESQSVSENVKSEDGNEVNSVDDDRRPPSRPIKISSRRVIENAESVRVAKLQVVNQALLRKDTNELRRGIRSELEVFPDAISTIAFIGENFVRLSQQVPGDMRQALEQDMINLLLSYMIRMDISSVSFFFTCSCRGVPKELASEYLLKLQGVCRELLEDPKWLEAADMKGSVDPIVSKYFPHWAFDISFSPPDIFIES
jgi:hypothetical protein